MFHFAIAQNEFAQEAEVASTNIIRQKEAAKKKQHKKRSSETAVAGRKRSKTAVADRKRSRRSRSRKGEKCTKGEAGEE